MVNVIGRRRDTYLIPTKVLTTNTNTINETRKCHCQKQRDETYRTRHRLGSAIAGATGSGQRQCETEVETQGLRSTVVFLGRVPTPGHLLPSVSTVGPAECASTLHLRLAHTCLRRLRREGDRASRYAQRHHFCVAAEYVLECWAQTMCGNPHLTSER